MQTPTKQRDLSGNSRVSKFEITGDFIPCLYFRGKSDVDQHVLFIHFHANGEDLQHCEIFGKMLSYCLGVNFLAVEFPNYGVYQEDPN